MKGKIFIVKCDGKELPYEGRMVKRGDPARGEYIHIVSKGSISEEVDLSSAYNFPVCDECQVGFKGRIYDVLRREESISGRRDEHHRIDIPGNSVVFRMFAP